jgi:hypothetical protein
MVTLLGSFSSAASLLKLPFWALLLSLVVLVALLDELGVPTSKTTACDGFNLGLPPSIGSSA